MAGVDYFLCVKVYFSSPGVFVWSERCTAGFVCFAAHTVTGPNDRAHVLNKPVIVWWACAGMSHSSDVQCPYYYQMSFQAAASPTGVAPPPPFSISAEQNIHSKREGG